MYDYDKIDLVRLTEIYEKLQKNIKNFKSKENDALAYLKFRNALKEITGLDNYYEILKNCIYLGHSKDPIDLNSMLSLHKISHLDFEKYKQKDKCICNVKIKYKRYILFVPKKILIQIGSVCWRKSLNDKCFREFVLGQIDKKQAHIQSLIQNINTKLKKRRCLDCKSVIYDIFNSNKDEVICNTCKNIYYHCGNIKDEDIQQKIRKMKQNLFVRKTYPSNEDSFHQRFKKYKKKVDLYHFR